MISALKSERELKSKTKSSSKRLRSSSDITSQPLKTTLTEKLSWPHSNRVLSMDNKMKMERMPRALLSGLC